MPDIPTPKDDLGLDPTPAATPSTPSSGASAASTGGNPGGGKQAAGAPSSVPAPASTPFPVGELTKTLQTLTSAVGALQRDMADMRDGRSHTPATPAAPTASPEAEADRIIQSFTEDPGGTIDSRAEKAAERVLTEKFGPQWQRVTLNLRDDLLDREAGSIDRRFGTGFFDEHVRDRLVSSDPNRPGALERLNPVFQADKTTVRAIIHGILGEMMSGDTADDVVKRMNDARREREVREAPNLMGPGVNGQPSNPDRISPEVAGQIQRMQDEGIDFSESDFREARQRGKTLSGWLAAANKGGGAH